MALVERATVMLDRVAQALAILALFGLALHTVSHAVSRYVFSNPLTGTNEYVSYWYMPVTVLLGIHLAQRGGEHIDAGLVFDRLPAANRTELQAFSLVLLGVVSGAFGWYGLRAATEAAAVGQTGGTMAIAVWPVMFVVPVAFGLLVVRVVIDLVQLLRPSRLGAADGSSDSPMTKDDQHVGG